MLVLHRVTWNHVWGYVCQDCQSRLALPYRGCDGSVIRWQILDERAAHIARTGVLADLVHRVAWEHRSKASSRGNKGDFTDTGGLMLVLVAHHHQRGLRIDLSDDVWAAALTLAALSTPWEGARLILDGR